MQSNTSTNNVRRLNSGLPPRKEIQVDGAQLSLIDAGVGPVVLLLHGYPQSLLMWRHQIPVLLNSNRVICPDWFGWGQSEKSFNIKPRYWDEVDRIGKLLDALSIESCNLIGHDYGGFLALGFAIRWPRRVTRLGIVNSRSHRSFSAPIYRRFFFLVIGARIPLVKQVLAMMPLGHIHRKMLAPFAKLDCFDETLIEHYCGWMDSPTGKKWLLHFNRYYELPARNELAQSLASIKCPTAIIWGDQDQACPWSIAKSLATTIPHNFLYRIHGGNHYIVEEKPAEVLEAIEKLIATEQTNCIDDLIQ